MTQKSNAKNLTIFGEELIDENSIRQIENCIGEEDIAVLTADAHYGYGHPIGGAVAYKNHVSLSGVGFDIACGNKAVRTDIRAEEVDIRKVMDEIFSRISFGVGRPNNEPIDHPVLDQIRQANFKPQRKMIDLAAKQLGTVGAGNHFVDLFRDDDGYLWIGVHFGSRGFGHKTTTGFIALSQGAEFGDRVKEGPMNSKPILFDRNSELGQAYIEAMQLAGEYAYAGRDAAVNKVLEILGNPGVTYEVHNHHNFAWEEEHFGENYWVVRKGCTPAFPGQKGFIGATMADTSVIVEGLESELSRKGLYSTVHGAGRVMSRTKAAGKRKWKKVKGGRRKPVIVRKGAVDFDVVRIEVKNKGIQLRGAGPDEAPQCYKRLADVLRHQGETIRVLHLLKPIGVAMAPAGTYDPYKD
ncbi:MAG: RtcB family protein [Bacteroidetes bacterium]|nr:RtcB family protein [Bacteroidota bacterium]